MRIPENPLRTIFPYPVKSSERMPEKVAAQIIVLMMLKLTKRKTSEILNQQLITIPVELSLSFKSKLALERPVTKL